MLSVRYMTDRPRYVIASPTAIDLFKHELRPQTSAIPVPRPELILKYTLATQNLFNAVPSQNGIHRLKNTDPKS